MITTPIPQTNLKNGQSPLDNTRPFMDDTGRPRTRSSAPARSLRFPWRQLSGSGPPESTPQVTIAFVQQQSPDAPQPADFHALDASTRSGDAPLPQSAPGRSACDRRRRPYRLVDVVERDRLADTAARHRWAAAARVVWQSRGPRRRQPGGSTTTRCTPGVRRQRSGTLSPRRVCRTVQPAVYASRIEVAAHGVERASVGSSGREEPRPAGPAETGRFSIGRWCRAVVRRWTHGPSASRPSPRLLDALRAVAWRRSCWAVTIRLEDSLL